MDTVKRVNTMGLNLKRAGCWTCEASGIGLAPGEWPAVLLFDCGDNLPPVRFERTLQQYSPSGELAGVRYLTPSTAGKRTVLMVFND